MTGWWILASWAVLMLIAWCLVAVGTGDPISPHASAKPRHHWHVPFALTRAEREANRRRYGRVA
jgi:hypothetical protein